MAFTVLETLVILVEFLVYFFWMAERKWPKPLAYTILANGVTTDEGAAAVEAALPTRPASHSDLHRLHQLASNELTGMLALLSDEEPRWADGHGSTVGDVRRLLDRSAG